MFISYQGEKIKFYTAQPLDMIRYCIDRIEETDKEYVSSGDEYILKEEWEEEQKQKEKERIAKLSLTKREVFLALYDAKGITPNILKAQITNPRALIEFEYANDYYRFNPLIDAIGSMLGYTSEDLDYLFINKKFPEPKPEPKPEPTEPTEPNTSDEPTIEPEEQEG